MGSPTRRVTVSETTFAITECLPPAAREPRPVHALVGRLVVRQSNEACSVLFESPRSWNPDLYIQLPIFPKPQEVVGALTRPLHTGFVQVRPAHVDGCEPISQSLSPLELGSGCQQPLRPIGSDHSRKEALKLTPVGDQNGAF